MDGVGWEYVAETNQEESELFTIYQGLDDTIGSSVPARISKYK